MRKRAKRLLNDSAAASDNEAASATIIDDEIAAGHRFVAHVLRDNLSNGHSVSKDILWQPQRTENPLPSLLPLGGFI